MHWVRYGSLLLALGVACGAFGAHALREVLDERARLTYNTAVLYHLVHALGLLAVGWLAVLRPHAGLVTAAGALLVSGILLFSGSLYALSVTGFRPLGAVTPFGGAAFIAGWICLAAAAR